MRALLTSRVSFQSRGGSALNERRARPDATNDRPGLIQKKRPHVNATLPEQKGQNPEWLTALHVEHLRDGTAMNCAPLSTD